MSQWSIVMRQAKIVNCQLSIVNLNEPHPPIFSSYIVHG